MKKSRVFFVLIVSLFVVVYIFWSQFFVKAQLIISEVYFAWTDERIEITNISEQDFSWTIIFSWAKSSNITINNVNIAAQQQAIFGDTMTMIHDHNLTGILNYKLVQKSWLGLSLYDTKDLFIELLSSGQIMDTIQAGADELAQIKSHKASLQKVQQTYSWETFIITWSQNFSGYNIVDDYIANPGILYSWKYMSWTTQETWTTNTWTLSWEICPDFNTQIKITEVFPGDEKYPPYIEIQALENFDGELLFSGDALFSSFQLNTTMRSGDYLLISNNASWWLSTLDTYIDPSFELNSSGSQISVYWQYRQLLDSAVLQFWTGSDAFYQQSTWECYRDFGRKNNFSPGFSEELFRYISSGSLVYIEVENNIETETIVYVNTGCSTTWELVTWTTTNTPLDITNWQFIEILSIDYDPPWSDVGNESVVLKSHVGYPVNIDHMRLHSLSRTTKNRIYGNIPANKQEEFVGNYRFPNSANCVELLSGDVILDRYCYDPADNESTTETTETDETRQDSTTAGQENTDMTQYKISIDNLVYDVEGSDTNREQIVLTLQDDSGLPVLDVDKIKEFTLMIWTRKTKLVYEDVNSLDTFSSRKPWETKTFTWNFRFPNSKNTCVALMRNKHIFDTYCYDTHIKEKNNAKNDLDNSNTTELAIKSLSGKIKITAILPNPLGSDAWSELVKLLYTPSTESSKFSINAIHSKDIQDLELDDNFRLQVNTTKKKISGTLTAGTEEALWWNFSFPNKAACVSLTFHEVILDTFCYTDPEEWELFTKKNWVLEHISTIDLSILQKASFKKIDDKVCLFFKTEQISCKTYSFSKYDPDELKLYKAYVNILNEYLSNNWPTLFYNSPLQYYKELLSSSKSKLKAGETIVHIYWKTIPIYDLEAQAKELIFATPTEILQRKVFDQLIPKSIREQYYFLARK